jgi:hypothetical protein
VAKTSFWVWHLLLLSLTSFLCEACTS